MPYRDLAERSWRWVLTQVGTDPDGPRLPDSVDSAVDGLYDGVAGLAPLLAELRLHRPWDDDEAELADAVVQRLLRRAADLEEPSLYDGLAGMAAGVRLLAPGDETPVLDRLEALRTPLGWRSTWGMAHDYLNDVVGGTAGILMTLLWAGRQVDVEPLPHTHEPSPVAGAAGLDWRMHPGYGGSSPNFSHGTAGVASLLALAGHVDLAVEGARHVLSVGILDDEGFVVPHTIPDSKREVERLTWGWCHGPTGLTYLFAALDRAGVQEVAGHDVRRLRRRCLDRVLAAGVPQRLRPGFWDNDGRCCGTAGVGEAFLDAFQTTGDEDLLEAAVIMGDALVERADGPCWRFVEHRNEQPLLPPGVGWMQGAAGIAAYLLRLARVREQGRAATVVDRPDQWWAVPDAVRCTVTP